MRQRSVLVTGANGFIGSHAVTGFVARGAEVTAVVSPRAPPSVTNELHPARVVRQHLSDSESIRALLEEAAPDVIVNAAVVGARPARSPGVEEVLSTNVLLPMRLYACMPSGCRLIQLGSMYEFGDFSRPIPETEASPISQGLYGWSKAAADGLLARAPTDPSKLCLRARAFLVIGPREGETRLVPSLVRAIRSGRSVDLSDGLQQRDILHVSDVVEGLVTLASASNAASGVFNVARGESVTIRSVAERVATRLGGEALLRFGALPRRAGEPDAVTAVASKLRALGWAPRLSVDETIDRAAEEETSAERPVDG